MVRKILGQFSSSDDQQEQPFMQVVLPALTRLTGGAARRLALLEQASTVTDGPATPTRCTSTRSPSRSSTGNTCCWTRTGQFVWHCQIVEHEDNKMRPKTDRTSQSGQPR
jgi:hypothetical protein